MRQEHRTKLSVTVDPELYKAISRHAERADLRSWSTFYSRSLAVNYSQ